MNALKFIALLVSIPVVFCSYSPEHSTRIFSLGSCDETNPCTIADTLCEKGICECRPGYTIDSSKTKCLKVATGYHDTCEDDAQCLEFLKRGAVCENKKCVCGSLFHYLHGRCYETSGTLNKSCENDDECFDGSEYQATWCKYGGCLCSDGFYWRIRYLSWKTCRRKQKKVGAECMMDWDCDFANGTCVEQKCVQNGKPMVAIRVETVKYATREDAGIKLGSKCKNDTDCQSIGNSICDVDGTCICDRAHFATEDMTGCVPEIGEACNSSEVGLKVEHAVCRENMWTCPIDRTASKDNHQCVKLTENIGETCKTNEQCRVFSGSAKCQYGTCQCDRYSYYHEKKNLCWPFYRRNSDLYNYCRKDSDCETPNSHCRNNTCSCNDYFQDYAGVWCEPAIHTDCRNNYECQIENSVCDEKKKTCECIADHVPVLGTYNGSECYPKLQYHDRCRVDAQCAASLPHMTCQLVKVVTMRFACECENDYYYKDEECRLKKWVGDDCIESDTCHASNSQCKSGRCQCLPGHSLVDSVVSGRECRPTLGAECEKNDDCGVSNSDCRKNKCSCKQYFVEDNGNCLGGINATCKKDNDCMKDTSQMQCQNNLCTCKSNYLPISSTECLSKMGHHGECKFDLQCSTEIANSFCNKTGMPRCDCAESHFFKDSKCHQKKLVDEKCSGPNECSTPNSYCNDGVCNCIPEFPKYTEGQCKNSSETTRSLLSFVVLVFVGLKTLF